MSDNAPICPKCGSGQTASRRQLFHAPMAGGSGAGAFDWYGERSAGALPPKSLFLMALALVAALTLPAAVLALAGILPLPVLLTGGWVLLVASLGLDLLVTRRRYRLWRGEWLCGACQRIFQPALP